MARGVDDLHPDQNVFERFDNIARAEGRHRAGLSSYGLHTDYHPPSDEPEWLQGKRP